MATLTDRQIKAGLQVVKGWKRADASITRTTKKKDFVRAMGFVNEVALLAEKMNHHPDIDIRWNTVTLTLSTHSAGGLTVLDFELAKKINAL